ncbi:DMT family transporter [Geobacter pickeringii]|nr:DMT family transporter [Geobacter pickeringii]
MIAFAGNSLLCRLALKQTAIDPASFTSLRILSGALALRLIMGLRAGSPSSGNWPSALALFAYAAGFSYAYVSLPTATGALLLFGAVQATMIGYGVCRGERLGMLQSAGLLCAFGGLAILLLPGLSAPPLAGSALMVVAGVAWGVYSLRGKGAEDPAGVTAGNFLRAVPMAAALSAIGIPWASMDSSGFWYAVVSGALASGCGYVLWYMALGGLKATSAAIVQLSVPVIAAVGGIVLLGEAITVRLMIASTAILGGIALVIVERQGGKGGGTDQ